MRNLLLLLSVLSVTASTAALAQRAGTDQEQKACARDVQRFCRPLMEQSDLVILGCLKENRPKLTKACNQVLVSHGQ